MVKITTDFAGGETIATTKTRLETILDYWLGTSSTSGVSTWGDLRTLLNSVAPTLVNIADGETGTSFRPKLNNLNDTDTVSSNLSYYRENGDDPEYVTNLFDGKYFVGSTASTFSGALNFSRTGTATYTDATGTLQTAADGVPRTDHHIWDGSAWVNQGLLIESDAATNLLTYSEQFDNAAWIKANVAVTPNTVVAPDGNSTADLLLSSANFARLRRTGVELVAGVTYCFSAWYLNVDVAENDPVSARQFVYDDVAKADVASNYIADDLVVAGVAWVRLSMTFTAVSTGAHWIEPIRDLNSGKSCYIWGAQLEAGSIPTSYIKTEATTATRNAETLTASAGDLPVPVQTEVTGIELVTNGTFDTDTSGWTAGNSAILSVDAQRLKITNGIASAGYAYQAINVVVGKTYVFEITTIDGTGVSYKRIGTSINGSDLYSDFAASSVSVTITATQTPLYITVGCSSGGAGQDALADNISVKEVIPKSYSIQMEGTMSYADEGQEINDGTFLYNWQLDSDNLIRFYLNTALTRTGLPVFQMFASGTADNSIGSSTYYSPGINVPFNIASRHGSTFINGAVDGTALTANTTPTALPDLTATDLEIAPNFNGTIKLLRIWGSDIGDTGIAQASA